MVEGDLDGNAGSTHTASEESASRRCLKSGSQTGRDITVCSLSSVDRAFGFEPKSREFKSLREYQKGDEMYIGIGTLILIIILLIIIF
jgi:hypothetical protein